MTARVGATIARPVQIALTSGAVIAAVVAHILLHWRGPWTSAAFSWTSFRGYYAGDQLSYLAIVANAAHGISPDVEPFTQTGTITFPRLYYIALGAVAGATGVPPTTVWAVGGLVVQAVLVAVVGIALALITRKWWSPVFAVVPFVLGTLALPMAGSWAIQLQSHAVLWGPFAVLFPLNGEVFGLSLVAIGLTLGIVAVVRPWSASRRTGALVIAAVFVGVTASIHTYAFLVGVSLSVSVAAWILIAYRRARIVAAVSAVLVVALFVLGPMIGVALGPLAALAFGITPALPGLVLGLVIFRWRALLPLVALAAAAAPQLVLTALGIVSGDPFLRYRVASSAELGVDWHGVVSAFVLVVPLAAVAIIGWRTGRWLWLGAPVGAVIGWFLLSTNDRWGANQEPYRFWIDSFVILSVLTLLLVADALASLARDRAAGRPRSTSRLVSIIAALIVPVISMVDFAAFSRSEGIREFIAFDDERSVAIGHLSAQAPRDGSLILTDTCVLPITVVLTSGRPVASFNPGMAWPERKSAIEELNTARVLDSHLDVPAAVEADVSTVIVDSRCDSGWEEQARAAGLRLDAEVDYVDEAGVSQRLQRWSITD